MQLWFHNDVHRFCWTAIPLLFWRREDTVSVGLKSCPLINFWPFAWVSCKSRYSGCFWRGLDDPYWFSDQRSKSNLCSSSIIDALVTHCLIVKKLGRVAGTRNKAIPFHFRLCCDLHSKHCSLMTSLLGTTIYSRYSRSHDIFAWCRLNLVQWLLLEKRWSLLNSS